MTWTIKWRWSRRRTPCRNREQGLQSWRRGLPFSLPCVLEGLEIELYRRIGGGGQSLFSLWCPRGVAISELMPGSEAAGPMAVGWRMEIWPMATKRTRRTNQSSSQTVRGEIELAGKSSSQRFALCSRTNQMSKLTRQIVEYIWNQHSSKTRRTI